MRDYIKCDCCNTILDADDSDKLLEDEIVCCMEDKKEPVLNEYCWTCALGPCNSKECLEFIKEENEAGRKVRQFKAKEVFW